MKFVFEWKVAQFVRRCNANGLAPEVRQLQGHIDELASQYLPDSCEKHVLLRLRERVLDPKWRQSLSICQRTLPNRPAITKEDLRKKAAILDHSRGAKSGGSKMGPKNRVQEESTFESRQSASGSTQKGPQNRGPTWVPGLDF